MNLIKLLDTEEEIDTTEHQFYISADRAVQRFKWDGEDTLVLKVPHGTWTMRQMQTRLGYLDVVYDYVDQFTIEKKRTEP